MAVKRSRSKLSRADAKRHYVELGELVVLRQIQADSKLLDTNELSVGPFARLDADAVAAQEGKTRGSITNLFGSQAAFQAETMALSLRASELVDQFVYPPPSDFPTLEAWSEAFFISQSRRGPHHQAAPEVSYPQLWALWLSTVPYGIWNDNIASRGMDEHRQWVGQLEQLFGRALRHFRRTLTKGSTLADLASAAASLIEGVWLNQCLTSDHPLRAGEPIETVLQRGGALLVNGAVAPAAGKRRMMRPANR